MVALEVAPWYRLTRNCQRTGMLMVNKCTRFVQRLLWPAVCVLCGGPGADGRDLCKACSADLPRARHACARCGCALPDSQAHRCGACLRRPPPFQHTVTALLYAAPVDTLVQRLKFHGRLQYAALLADLLADAVEATHEPRPSRLIPVPLHPSRQRQRGFNQATELARCLGKRLDIAVHDGCAQRVRATDPQSLLNGRARRSNLRGAFAVQGHPGDHVAIVDDVMTTGSTVRTLALALRRGGARRVDVWCAARAEPV